MGQMGFYFDQTACIGCKTCQVACRDKNALYNVGEIFRRVETVEVGTFPSVRYYGASISCNHCERPACVANCPSGAMYKDEDEGVVLHDDGMCIGCETCVSACPYGEPVYLEDEGIVRKCDSCVMLRKKGENPARCARSISATSRISSRSTVPTSYPTSTACPIRRKRRRASW